MSISPSGPHVVVMSGSLSQGSRTERLAQWCAHECERRGAATSMFLGADLEFPFYRPMASGTEGVRRFLAALVRADGVVLVSPTYHGSLSGLLKNALDYVDELGEEEPPFLDGRPVGCVALALGEQGATSTIATLRVIAHALRGWPTPLGVALSTSRTVFDRWGRPADERASRQLDVLLDQVLSLAMVNQRRRDGATVTEPPPGAAAAGARDGAMPLLHPETLR